MSFPAKFGGRCVKCAGLIAPGGQVNYDGHAIRHAPRCPAAGTVTEVAPPPPREEEKITDATKVLGRATYKGKTGYLILWLGTTSRGEAAKLAFRDGTKIFWTDRGAIAVEKRYDEPITYRRLNQLADEFREQKAEEERAAKAQSERTAAQSAKAAAEGKTVAEIVAEERIGCRDFSRDGKNAVAVGEKTTTTAKDGTVRHYEVVSVGAPYNHTNDDCEDLDCFCGRYGWRTPYTAREIPATTEQLAAETQKREEDGERNALAAAIRDSYGADTHLGSGAPKGVAMTHLWGASRMAGSESWHLGSDGTVYHMRSDYDMGPTWWRTSATPAQIERAKALGMKVVY
jgi:hypothetical protein